MDLVWSEIVTQIIGFVLAVWILGRFAWKPILGLLEERRRSIEEAHRTLAQERRDVEEQKAHYEEELRNIETRARERLQEVVREANAIAARIREETQAERRERLARVEEEVARILESAQETLRQRTVELAIAAAERILREELDEERHRRLVRDFIEKVETVP